MAIEIVDLPIKKPWMVIFNSSINHDWLFSIVMLKYQGVRGLKPHFAQKKNARWTVTIFETFWNHSPENWNQGQNWTQYLPKLIIFHQFSSWVDGWQKMK